MAIVCEFIDVVVKISTIDRAYPGGWAAFKRQNAPGFGGKLWHDDHLFRDGAMSGRDADVLLEEWKALGLELTEALDGQVRWKDVCVCGEPMGPTLPCDWIIFNAEDGSVYLRGTAPGPVIGREDFRRAGTEC
jgi:hypothetical protein